MIRTRLGASMLVAVGFLASCRSHPTATAPSFFTATLHGTEQTQYVGTGTFNTIPHGSVRFIVGSRGLGESAGEGLAFHAVQTPGPGEYLIGEIDENTHRAIYWRDEDSRRTIYVAHAGTVRIEHSTSSRVAGSFSLQAYRRHDCTLVPGFPAPFLNCEPAGEQDSVEITGVFEARPMGGAGLTPYPG